MFGASKRGPDAQSRGLESWALDPITRNAQNLTIDHRPQDFPRIDERFFGRSYRYAWSVALPPKRDDRLFGANALYAIDVIDGHHKVHDFGPGRPQVSLYLFRKNLIAPKVTVG